MRPLIAIVVIVLTACSSDPAVHEELQRMGRQLQETSSAYWAAHPVPQSSTIHCTSQRSGEQVHTTCN